MLRREVREPVRRRLVGHGERVAQVLHRDPSQLLRRAEHPDGVALGQQQCGRQVVGLDALPQKVGIVSRLLVSAEVAGERLQDR